MARQVTAAVPSTPAQCDRYQRILLAATEMLAGGEKALQMKVLTERADVSLATLYRYFPSKDYLMLAIAQNRCENALRRVLSESPRGATVQERVTNHLIREFCAEQRNQRLATALVRVLGNTGPEYDVVNERTQKLRLRMIEHVALTGAPVNDHLSRRLQIVIYIYEAATSRWLAGLHSAADARFEIMAGCYLLVDPDKEAA
jgi:TetR/AcrR family transcriptional regulator, cholesterol catabolism regulator